MSNVILVILIGIGATAVMDLWAILRNKLLGIPPTNWGMVGRWMAHMLNGQFRHDSITSLNTINYEHLIGWVVHYLTGIIYAGLLIGICGISWMHDPTITPALIIGISTVVMPLFIMQPCMGMGVAASKTPKPNSVRLHSFINHTVFGLGLYVSGLVVELAFSI